jgi:hypothetical protein|nr:hypothetical protein [Bacteroides intestinalis]
MLEEPRFIQKGYEYFDDNTGKWCIKEDAPEWAKKEFQEFYNHIDPEPDDDGIVTIA